MTVGTEASATALLPLAFLGLIAVAVAVYDVRTRRIPNWLCLVTAVLGLIVSAALQGFEVLPSHGLHMLLALTGGAVLFALRVVGGGDAKFYAATGAWFSLKQALLLLSAIGLAGLGLLVIWVGYRRFAGMPLRSVGDGPFDSLPYGVAIGCGAVVTMSSNIG